MLSDKLFNLGDGLNWVDGSWRKRSPNLFGNLSRGYFVTQLLNGTRVRANPNQTGINHRLGELSVFGKEPISGVNCIGTASLCNGDQFLDNEVGLCCCHARKRVGLIGMLNVLRVSVALCVNRYRQDACVFCGANNAYCNLASVGDQQLLDAAKGHNPIAYWAIWHSFWRLTTKKLAFRLD